MTNKQITPSPAGPEYEFAQNGSLVFLTGAPMSGKSTIGPLIAASIEGCTLQNMDIFRLLMGRENDQKEERDRNPVLEYGSCDSYLAIDSGEYSLESLILGLQANSEAICAPLDYVIPRLEVQGAQNVAFEGVQLLPDIVRKFMEKNSRARYLIFNSSEEAYQERRRRLYSGDSAEFGMKYTNERLKAIEGYIIEQARQLPEGSVCVIDNSNIAPEQVAGTALEFLTESGLIIKK